MTDGADVHAARSTASDMRSGSQPLPDAARAIARVARAFANGPEPTAHQWLINRACLLRSHLADFLAGCNFARRLKTLYGLTPYEHVCKVWTSQPDGFIVNPIHQMPGPNTWQKSLFARGDTDAPGPHGLAARGVGWRCASVKSAPNAGPLTGTNRHRRDAQASMPRRMSIF